MPPALNIPEKVTDLRAVQRGGKIVIDYTVPALTTERLPVKHLGPPDLQIGDKPVEAPSDKGHVEWPRKTGLDRMPRCVCGSITREAVTRIGRIR